LERLKAQMKAEVEVTEGEEPVCRTSKGTGIPAARKECSCGRAAINSPLDHCHGMISVNLIAALPHEHSFLAAGIPVPF